VSSSVAPERLGGSEAYAADLAAALAERHDVLLHTGARTAPPGVELARLPALPDLTKEASRGHKAVWHLRDQWRLAVHTTLKQQLRHFRPDVVHTQHPQGLSAAVFSAVAADDLPHAHTVHDANALCARITMTTNGRFCGGHCVACLPQRRIRSALLKRSLGRLIAPSDYFKQMHVRAGVVPADRAQTIRQGAQPGTSRIRATRGDSITLGFVGALAPHKGVPTLLTAFHAAPSQWRLWIAGAGPLQAKVRRVADSDPRIRFTGVVDGAAKDEFLDGMDLLVIPSEYEENAPLVAVEAAVRALPMVVSDRGGLPETPEATVFRAGDPGRLLESIAGLAESPDAMAAKSTRLDKERPRFLWSHHVEQVERALEATIG
jgi:glycosyltransferase involved in cell wall biosynthesis